MKSTTVIGTYEDAIKELKEGDQFFESRDGTCTIRRLSPYQETITFIPENKKVSNELLTFCELTGLNPYQPTGRICRQFLRRILQIDVQSERDTSKKRPIDYFGKHILEYTKANETDAHKFNKPQKGHWNYYYFRQLKQPTRAIYWDIKKAYLEALKQQPSIYFVEPKHWAKDPYALDKFVTQLVESPDWAWKQYSKYWVDDNGAMSRLQEWLPHIPSEIRWQMLGIVGSHEFPKQQKIDGKTVIKIIQKIEWGAFFNSVQISCLWLWKVMEKLSRIAQKDGSLILAHTDGLLCGEDMTPEVEQEFFQCAEKYGLTLRAKELGMSFFYNHVNSGFVGAFNIKGNSIDVRKQMLGYNHNFAGEDITHEFWERWKHRLDSHEWIGRNGSVKGWLQKQYYPLCDVESKKQIPRAANGVFWSQTPLKNGTCYNVFVTEGQIEKGIKKL